VHVAASKDTLALGPRSANDVSVSQSTNAMTRHAGTYVGQQAAATGVH
jgi:hypothetical protein